MEHSYEVPVRFPQLDSFPRIFSLGKSKLDTISVKAAVSSSSAMAQQIRQAGQISRLLIDVEEREAIVDGLQTICEEYEEGWTSGSDEDED